MIKNLLNNGYKSRIVVGIIIQVVLLIGGAQAANITVNASGGANYTNIQEAINAANDSDSIYVAAGNYNENVNVNKSVSLIGEGSGNTTVNASIPSSHVFNISKNDVVLNGFTIKGAVGSNEAGIYVFKSNNTRILNNSLTINYNGIYLYNSSGNNLTNNYIEVASEGIYLINGANNTIQSNTISKSNDGMYFHKSFNNSLNGNNISNNHYGIYLYSSGNNYLTDNIVNSNVQLGIQLYYSENNYLKNNSVNSNGNQGIQIYGSGYNNLTENTINLSRYYGIYLYATINNNIYNNIFNNTYNFAIVNSSGNVWNVTGTQDTNIIGGPYKGGNFWANPSVTGFSQTCIDINIDGFCDSIYTMIIGNADNLPLTVSRGYLNGTITSNGSAVPGASIFTPVANTTSGTDGKYSLILPGGIYNLTVTKQPTHNDGIAAAVIVNPYNTTTVDIVLEEKPTGTISGTVITI